MLSSPTRSSQLITEAIALGPSALLKSLGFRKNGPHFFRVSADGSCHLSFQSSQWNSPDRSKFTVNLWTYLPAIAIANGEILIAEPVKQRLGHCGIRLGHLFPEPEDYWWQISSPIEVPQRADEVCCAIEKYAIPYLDRALTLQGVSELSGQIPGICSLPTRSKASALRLLGREQDAIAVERALEGQAGLGQHNVT